MSPTIVGFLAVAFPLFAWGAVNPEDPKPEGRFTVVTFGDSTTAVRAGAVNYTTQLEERLGTNLPAVRFLNKGVGGNTTELGRRRFEKDVLAQKPDLVVIQFGINDSTVDVWKNPPAVASRVALATYQENLRYFIEQIRRQGGDVVLMTPNQLRWKSALILEKYGKPPYDPNDEKGFTHRLAAYAEAVRKIAKDSSVPLIDMYSFYGEWEQVHGRSCSELTSDGIHPNTQGHQCVADALEPLIKAKAAQHNSAE